MHSPQDHFIIILLATDVIDATLRASGLWLGTRTGASGTVILTKSFLAAAHDSMDNRSILTVGHFEGGGLPADTLHYFLLHDSRVHVEQEQQAAQVQVQVEALKPSHYLISQR